MLFISYNSTITFLSIDRTLFHLMFIQSGLRLGIFLLIDSHIPIPGLPEELLFLSSTTLSMMTSSSSFVKGPLSERWLHIETHLFYQFHKTKAEEMITSRIEIVNYEQNLLGTTFLICSWFWRCWPS